MAEMKALMKGLIGEERRRRQASEAVYFLTWARIGDNPGYAPDLDVLQAPGEDYDDFLDRAAAKALQLGTRYHLIHFLRTHDEHAARLNP